MAKNIKPTNEKIITNLDQYLSFTRPPTNAPIRTPKGPRNRSPMTRPIVEPHIPDFVPPNFFAPNAGII